MKVKRSNTNRDASGMPITRANTFGKKTKCPKNDRRKNKKTIHRL